MQTASCFVRLLNTNGPHKNEAFKVPVTPAEIVILRMIHGDDAVVNVKLIGSDKREHRAEVERLRYEYGPAVVERAFPGHSPRLPVSLADVGIDVAAEDDEEGAAPAPAGKSKGKKGKAAAEPAPATADADVGDGKYDPAIDGE